MYDYSFFSLIILEVYDLSYLTKLETKYKAYLDRESYYISCVLDDYREKVTNILNIVRFSSGLYTFYRK